MKTEKLIKGFLWLDMLAEDLPQVKDRIKFYQSEDCKISIMLDRIQIGYQFYSFHEVMKIDGEDHRLKQISKYNDLRRELQAKWDKYKHLLN